MYNHLGCPFCTGRARVGDSTVCLGACDGTEGPERVMGIGVLAEVARGGCDRGAVGAYISSGSWLGYAGPFIVSEGPLIPLRDRGLTVPGDG